MTAAPQLSISSRSDASGSYHNRIAYASTSRVLRRLSEATAGTVTTITGVGDGAWLASAISELSEACIEAHEEGVEVSSSVVDIAKDFVCRLASKVSTSPSIYHTPEGGIAIDFQNSEHRSGVLIICEPGNGASLYYNDGSNTGRARFSDPLDALDSFAWGALKKSKIL